MFKPDWEARGIKLFNGDCAEVLKAIRKVDAVIADPPYAIPTQVAQTRTTHKSVGDLSIAETAFRVFANEWKRMLGEDGRAFVFCDGASYSVAYRAMYGRYNLASLVWDKGRIGMGREFRKRHELIIHAWGSETEIVESNGTGFPDVLEFEPIHATAKIHPAEKPVDLIQSLLRVCGEVVIDPFMGSGTTGEACILSGRKFVGVEIDPEYFADAVARMERAIRRREKRGA